MSKYLKQLAADLPRWVGLGYVSEPNATLILRDAEANQKEGWFRLPMILSMLGSLLVFAGIISWVAGNWDDLPRLLRTALLVGAMLLSLGVAHVAREKGSDGLGHGFAFLAALLFGADIMLIAQIYQLPANPPGGALLWALGATAVAIFWPSQLSMALAFVLAGIWSWFSTTTHGGEIWSLFWRAPDFVHWPFLLFWGALAAFSVKQGWTRALHAAGLTLTFWLCFTLFTLFDQNAARVAGMAIMLVVAALTLAGQLLHTARPGAGVVSKYVWALFGLWLLFFSSPDLYREVVRYGDVAHPVYYVVGLVAGLGGFALSLRNYARDGVYTPVAAGLAIASLVALMAATTGAHEYVSTVYYANATGLRLFWGQVAVSVLAMAAAVGAVVHGYRSNEKFFINIGFVLFAFKLIWLYFDNEWGLNNRAAFFIVGGLLIVGLGVVFDSQRRKLIAKMNREA